MLYEVLKGMEVKIFSVALLHSKIVLHQIVLLIALLSPNNAQVESIHAVGVMADPKSERNKRQRFDKCCKTFQKPLYIILNDRLKSPIQQLSAMFGRNGVFFRIVYTCGGQRSGREKQTRVNWARYSSLVLEHDVKYLNRLIFSAKGSYSLLGVVNKKNCRVWGTKCSLEVN